MKPKMKKNPDYRRGHNSNNNKTRRHYESDGDYDDGNGASSFDKKYSNRRERRIFSDNNIARVYRERIEPRLRAEEMEDNLIDVGMTDK